MINRPKFHSAIVFLVSAIMVASGCQRKPPAPRLVILYATCTVNKDFLSPYNARVRFTPNIEAFAQDAMVFTRHITEAGQSGIAYASIFSGVHADIHGVYRHPVTLGGHVYQISEAYRDAGYETFFWSGHKMASYDLNYGQGVAKSNVYVWEHKNLSGFTATNDQFANILKRLKEDPQYKAFVQINFTITHDPYQKYATEEVQQRFHETFPNEFPRFGEKDLPRVERLLEIFAAKKIDLQRNFPETVTRLGLSDEDVRDLALVQELFYKACINQLDTYFGRLVDSIRAAGLFDQSLIVFTADHGEILYRENALYKWTHGLQLVPEVLNVPLIMSAPSQGIKAGRYDNVTRSIDVYPTMAALSGMALPANVPVEGVDLSPALLGREPAPELIAFSHTSTLGDKVLENYKLQKLALALKYFPREDVNLSWVSARKGDMVYKKTFDSSKWGSAVFDLSVDRAETHNLYDSDDPDHRDMFKRLDAYKQRLVRTDQTDLQKLSPEDLENLKSLGYIGGEQPPREGR